MAAILLKPGREKSLLRKHPWIFSGAIAEVRNNPGFGEVVDVLASDGSFLARAAYSPQSQIRARVWSWDEQEQIDEQFLRVRLAAAIQARRTLVDPLETDSLRLVHGESDRLPGLIVDRYAGVLVVQFLSAGIERWRAAVSDLLVELTGAQALYERSDADVRQLEGLPPRAGLLRGSLDSERVEIRENGLRFVVDLDTGHKTGFYLDQRENRLVVQRLAAGLEVLDCFSYTGGFALASLAGGAASVVAVEASPEAIAGARRNLAANHLPAERIEWLEGDVFQVLRRFRDSRRSFDLIVLDPPKFAATAAQVERAARGYKDINLLAFKLLRPGGLLVTFSCSGGVSEDLFQKIVAGAAADAGIHAQILRRLHQGPDHPVALNFPEGAYLKGLVLRVS
jgi:23S rRNA (cytosine1962-C5)-methyltransferase